MKYIAILKGSEGCDHSIGCGNAIFQIEAESYSTASFKLKNHIKSNYNSDGYKLEVVVFFEVNKTFQVDIKLWYDEFAKEAKDNAVAEETEMDLREFKRLKSKYNL